MILALELHTLRTALRTRCIGLRNEANSGEVRPSHCTRIRLPLAAFLTDAEFAKLEALADEKDEPLSAVAYKILARFPK